MSEPIVFISHSRIKEGMLEAFRDASREMMPLIERDKPGTVVFLLYTDENDTELHVVHVFPDAAAFDRHLEGADERVAKALAFIDPAGYEIYGSPTEQTLETMRGFASELGVPLTLRPLHLSGYIRPAEAESAR
jgi:quinol monooxygenase YgiN